MALFAPNIPRLKAKKDIGGLIKALRNKDHQIRQGAAEALGLVGDPLGIEPLAATAGDSNAQVRGKAVEALGRIGDPEAVKPLTLALEDEDKNVRRAAAAALEEMMLGRNAVVLAALEEIGDRTSVEALIRVLNGSEITTDIRDAAAATLAKIGGLAVHPLVATLGDTNKGILARLAAANALGKIGDPRALEPLVAALRDSDWRLREETSGALGKIGDSRAVDPLAAALEDKIDTVRRRAVEALEDIGSPAVGLLIATLQDTSKGKDIRQAAATALGKIGDARAIEPLAAAIGEKESGVYRAAVIALRMMGDPRAEEPLTREIDMELKNLFLAPAQERSTEALLVFVPASWLSGKVAKWAAAASGYETKWSIHGDVQHLDLSDSDEAVRRLCELDSPVTSNVLHLVARKKDITVSLASCAYTDERRVSFHAQRESAAAELERRGNPPYLPEAYVQGNRDSS